MRGADGLLTQNPEYYLHQAGTRVSDVRDPTPLTHSTPPSADDWYRRYLAVRQRSIQLCQPLNQADHELQAAPFTSPAKWHLAHTSWFFETFILKQQTDYPSFHPQYEVLFNSYYNGVGEQFPRHQRGLLSRPSLAEVMQYRQHIDRHIQHWIEQCPSEEDLGLLELGINHEQQHQELLLTDLLYSWSQNPLAPVYSAAPATPSLVQRPIQPTEYCVIPQGTYTLGYAGDDFHFDNETPAHQQLINDFQIATHAVSNRDYLAFLQDGGYQRAELWLADGWNWVQQEQITAPLYWQEGDEGWRRYSLNGWLAIDGDDLVRHVSFYEADAFARWSGQRLPTEFEWEVAYARCHHRTGALIEQSGLLTPLTGTDDFCSTQASPISTPADSKAHEQNASATLIGMLGNTWEWTSSPYMLYPGYQPAAGAVGEYNGKFMCNQMVLRGGSCLTPSNHIRPTYRNFFYPHERWQMTGIRLAK